MPHKQVQDEGGARLVGMPEQAVADIEQGPPSGPQPLQSSFFQSSSNIAVNGGQFSSAGGHHLIINLQQEHSAFTRLKSDFGKARRRILELEKALESLYTPTEDPSETVVRSTSKNAQPNAKPYLRPRHLFSPKKETSHSSPVSRKPRLSPSTLAGIDANSQSHALHSREDPYLHTGLSVPGKLQTPSSNRHQQYTYDSTDSDIDLDGELLTESGGEEENDTEVGFEEEASQKAEETQLENETKGVAEQIQLMVSELECLNAEVARLKTECQKKEGELRRNEEDIRRIQVEARQREEEIRVKEAASLRVDEEQKRKEEILKKKNEDLTAKEKELENSESELRRRLKEFEEKSQRKEREMHEREAALSVREGEVSRLAAEAKKTQEEARQELVRIRAERITVDEEVSHLQRRPDNSEEPAWKGWGRSPPARQPLQKPVRTDEGEQKSDGKEEVTKRMGLTAHGVGIEAENPDKLRPEAAVGGGEIDRDLEKLNKSDEETLWGPEKLELREGVLTIREDEVRQRQAEGKEKGDKVEKSSPLRQQQTAANGRPPLSFVPKVWKPNITPADDTDPTFRYYNSSSASKPSS